MQKSTLALWFLVSLLAAVLVVCISLGFRVAAAAEDGGCTSRSEHAVEREPWVAPFPLAAVMSSRHAEA